jgi:hypothetical protein
MKRALNTASGGSTAPRSTPHVTLHIDSIDEDEEDGFEDDEPDDDTLGYKAEYGTRNFSASIKVDGNPAGRLSARLLNRPSREFYAACDADSAALQQFGCVLFGSTGKPRYAALKSDASARSGGFLYISTFSVAHEFREEGATDVGAAAIGALLCHPDITERWTVAAYIADSQEWMTLEEQQQQREMSTALFQSGQAESASARAKRVQVISERMAKDARQFVRAGFKEIDYQEGGWLYVTKGMTATPPLTHEAALAQPLKVAAKAAGVVAAGDVPSPSGKDAELLEFMAANRAGASPAVLANIDELIAQGARPTEAHALQCAAANDVHQLFQPLIARGAHVNGTDENGCTPLMIAAEVALGKVRLGAAPSTQAIAALIALGADKNLTDKCGRTALGLH